jgi:hypothetical protein
VVVLAVAGVTGVKLGVMVRLEGDREGGSMKGCIANSSIWW